MPIPPGSEIHTTFLTAPVTTPEKTKANGTSRGRVLRGWGRRLIAGSAPRVDARDHTGWYQDAPARRIVPRAGGVSTGRLARSRADDELREDVYRRLRDCQLVRLDLPGIAIHARDGIVWLQGHVSSDSKRRRADDVLRGLAYDPRTARQRIGVYPSLGVMRLRGIVRTPTAHAGAWEIAAAVPLVKQVVNELHVDPDADVLPDLAGVSNNYDLAPGGR